MTARLSRLLVLAICLAASSLPTASAPVAAMAYPDDLVWLALGDSYSSGEGLRYIDQQANPPGRTCERATGRTSVNDGAGSRAWAAVAYDLLRGDMTDSRFALLACTGAVSNEIHAQYRDEWLDLGEARADLISFSMGGNNLGFSDLIMRCIGLSITNSTGAGIVLNPAIGCDSTEKDLKEAVDRLVGTLGVGPDGGQTLRDMYREVAENAVNSGGHVIVAGYPNIVEESARWSLGWVEGNRCSRIRRSDTAMLRSVTGYLNQKLAQLVDELDRQFNNVSFHWLDVSQVYEGEAGRHGLCTGEPWINGLTLGLGGPDSGSIPIRYQRSFHPNQKGHDATGEAVAALVRNLDWTDLDRLPPIDDEPDASPHGSVSVSDDGTTVLAYDHPSLGPVTITIEGGSVVGRYGSYTPSVTAVQMSTGEVVYGWQAPEAYEEFRFWGLSQDDEVDSPVDLRGHVFFNWNPGRFTGVSVLTPTDEGFDSGGTLTDDFYNGYYYAYVVDADDDGFYEIDQHFQICEPTCADGIYYNHLWAWDGQAYSGPSDPPGPTAAESDVSSSDAESIFMDYLLAAGARDYSTAWAMLSAEYQSEYGSYEAFVSFWQTVDVVGINDVEAGPSGNGMASITVTLWFDLVGRGRQTEIVEVDVGRSDGRLLITDYRFIRTI